MTDPLYDKLAFNGFHVVYWNHETRRIEYKEFPTYQSVMDRKFEEIPSAEVFATDLFDVFGDCVGSITDNRGVILYNNLAEMRQIELDMRGW